jgi:hypothetical protein
VLEPGAREEQRKVDITWPTLEIPHPNDVPLIKIRHRVGPTYFGTSSLAKSDYWMLTSHYVTTPTSTKISTNYASVLDVYVPNFA